MKSILDEEIEEYKALLPNKARNSLTDEEIERDIVARCACGFYPLPLKQRIEIVREANRRAMVTKGGTL
ncbi:hypothetical protein BIT28_03375 [Photobacterium proteolyticum]|uniref:Uncharacterized protein n=1 Tax=Photobacterium proteolyticum TaxID=1903952 RepID=A0A1Q9GAC3_9GAMM|nr:hypothetical protein [Photobacterium proteolyticum]OLQ71220.1 hypothetical protein BIT28_03375 [Photobacterium proteolyticum]